MLILTLPPCMHGHCFAPAVGSCDICRTELITTTEVFASKAERETIIWCALDLEVHLKSENKCLRVQLIAL